MPGCSASDRASATISLTTAATRAPCAPAGCAETRANSSSASIIAAIMRALCWMRSSDFCVEPGISSAALDPIKSAPSGALRSCADATGEVVELLGPQLGVAAPRFARAMLLVHRPEREQEQDHAERHRNDVEHDGDRRRALADVADLDGELLADFAVELDEPPGETVQAVEGRIERAVLEHVRLRQALGVGERDHTIRERQGLALRLVELGGQRTLAGAERQLAVRGQMRLDGATRAIEPGVIERLVLVVAPRWRPTSQLELPHAGARRRELAHARRRVLDDGQGSAVDATRVELVRRRRDERHAQDRRHRARAAQRRFGGSLLTPVHRFRVHSPSPHASHH